MRTIDKTQLLSLLHNYYYLVSLKYNMSVNKMKRTILIQISVYRVRFHCEKKFVGTKGEIRRRKQHNITILYLDSLITKVIYLKYIPARLCPSNLLE